MSYAEAKARYAATATPKTACIGFSPSFCYRSSLCRQQ